MALKRRTTPFLQEVILLEVNTKYNNQFQLAGIVFSRVVHNFNLTLSLSLLIVAVILPLVCHNPTTLTASTWYYESQL